MTRVVIDANVFVSAVLTTRGNAAQILDAWRTKQFELVVSSVIPEELARVLQYPRIAKRHGLSEERIQEFLDELAHLALQTPGELTLDVIKGDPSDNRYLECAVEGAADVIVRWNRTPKSQTVCRRRERSCADDLVGGSRSWR